MSVKKKDESVSEEIIRDLVDRKLSWPRVKELMSSEKDPDRFDKYIRVLQEKVPWKEKIVLPIHEHLFIVCKNGKLIVKTFCGEELGDYRENWKLKTLVHVRETDEELQEIFPGLLKPDPEVTQLREFYCPKCGTLLDVESFPRGYPVIFEFLPDVESFYTKWLGRSLPCEGIEPSKEKEISFQDKSVDVLKKWAGEEEEEKSEEA
nr:acetone carboxylase subunit gamma [Candidatus Njordarchaeum guaymaensis]